jgi:hypothetical protein
MRKTLLGISASVGLTALSVAPASAEAFASDAIQRYRLGDPGMFTFLSGNLNGLISANAELRSNGHAELFCVPPSEVLGVQQTVEILSKRIKEIAADGQRPVGSVMLQSLKQSFPCK